MLNNLYAVLPAGLAAIAVLLGWLYGPAALRAVRRFFSYPFYGGTALCPHCLQPLPYQDAPLCPVCRTPVTSIATYDPILRVASTGALYRKAVRRLVGAGLAGVLFLAFFPVVAAVLVQASGEERWALGLAAAGLPWLLVFLLNVLRGKRHEGLPPAA